MSQLHLSDEILMAFADGELEEPSAAAVAKAMAEDPAVAKRIMDFQQSRRLTRSAFSAVLMPDVPPQLRAAVSAQVKAYEPTGRTSADPDSKPPRSERLTRRPEFVQWALAASIAAIGLALGYVAGSWGAPEAGGLMAQLESPVVHRELSRTPSGDDVELPVGRLRVISTYRLADGSLCREFRLQSSGQTAEAVACRNGGWSTTFAMAGAANDTTYTPSGGGDPMAAYLQDINAGEPLVGETEARALAGAAR